MAKTRRVLKRKNKSIRKRGGAELVTPEEVTPEAVIDNLYRKISCTVNSLNCYSGLKTVEEMLYNDNKDNKQLTNLDRLTRQFISIDVNTLRGSYKEKYNKIKEYLKNIFLERPAALMPKMPYRYSKNRYRYQTNNRYSVVNSTNSSIREKLKDAFLTFYKPKNVSIENFLYNQQLKKATIESMKPQRLVLNSNN